MAKIACQYCSSTNQLVFHNGPCPRVRAVDYYENGTVRRVEFQEGGISDVPEAFTDGDCRDLLE